MVAEVLWPDASIRGQMGERKVALKMALSGWKWLPSPYGPGWTWLSALPYAATAGSDDATRAVLAFKGLAVICLVATTAGVAIAAERLRPGTGAAAAVLFGWNPLVLIHLAADGHNDAAMLALLAWGTAALTFRRPGAALALLAAGGQRTGPQATANHRGAGGRGGGWMGAAGATAAQRCRGHLAGDGSVKRPDSD